MQTTPIAENHVTVTRPLFNEAMRTIGKKGYLKQMKGLMLVMIIVYVLIAAWGLHNNGSPIMLVGETFTLAALLIWMFIFLPRSKWKTKYKLMTQNGQITPTRIIRFYSDHLSVTVNSGKTTEMSYKKISEWQETPNLYVLHCEKNVWLLLGKEGFTKGDFEVVKSKLSH